MGKFNFNIKNLSLSNLESTVNQKISSLMNGDVNETMTKIESIQKATTIEGIAERAGINIPPAAQKAIDTVNQIKSDGRQMAMDYAKDHGVDLEKYTNPQIVTQIIDSVHIDI